MVETPLENLAGLYRQVDECALCDLGDANPPPRLRFKLGAESRVLLVGQNPGCRVVHGCNHIWGGLDYLRTRTKDKESLALLDAVLDVVWITNAVKCRTDDDRPPRVKEKKACLEFLLKEIRYIKPVKVMALGSVAQEWLARNDIKFTPLAHPCRRQSQDKVVEYIRLLHGSVFD